MLDSWYSTFHKSVAKFRLLENAIDLWRRIIIHRQAWGLGVSCSDLGTNAKSAEEDTAMWRGVFHLL